MKRWINRLMAVAFALAATVTVMRAPAVAADMQAEGARAVAAWVAAVTSGERDTVAAILAPEFQIVRENGIAYDREGYLASNLPKIAAPPPVSDLVVTGDGDVMVARYVLVIDATVNGAKMQAKAPRLTTFRLVDGMWRVSAHANFATITP